MSTQTTAPEETIANPHASEFDFWLGTWNVLWGENPESREKRGTNTITKILENQVVFEHFNGRPTLEYEGMSHSVFDVNEGVWKQTWVDSQATYLDFKGGFADGKMILSRDTVKDGKPIQQRMVWYNIAPDSLEWNWERSLDGGQTWETLWHIIYERQ